MRRGKTGPNAGGGSLINPRLSQVPSVCGIALNMDQLCEMRLQGIPFWGHDDAILRKKKQKQIEDATKASVKKEMAQPRMARSARIAGLILGKARLPAIQGRKPPQIRRPASDSV